MGKGTWIALVIMGVLVYWGSSSTKSYNQVKNPKQSEGQSERLWKTLSNQVDLNDYPNINKDGWCGLNFEELSIQSQSNFADYLSQYKSSVLEKTKSLPATDLKGNLEGYKKLSCMEPDNELYMSKVDDYGQKVELLRQQELERRNSAWDYYVSTDEMSGKQSVYLRSDEATTIRPMSFPYTGTRSSISFGCDKKNMWAYFWFSKSPNITKDETRSGYNLSTSRISFDDKLDTVTLTQDWGSNFMHVRYDSWLSKNLVGTHTLKLELNWHGQNRTIFNYRVNGFKPVFDDFRNKCAALK